MSELPTETLLGVEMGEGKSMEVAPKLILNIANSPVSSEVISQLFYESSNCWKKESFEKLKQYGEEGMLLAKGFLMRMYAFGSGLANQDSLLAEEIAKEILPILQTEAEYRNGLKEDLEKRKQARVNSERQQQAQQSAVDANEAPSPTRITIDETKAKEENEIISHLEKEVKELKYIDYLISSCYHKGIGVEASEDLSFKHAFASSLLGYAPAQNYVGYCFEKGVGTSISLAEALRHYHLAADQNHAAAQYNLGLYYKNKRLPVYDEKKSFTYFMQSAVQNNIDSQYFVGIFYQEGVGTDGKNDAEAVKWFRRSAEQGCLWSQNSLGRCYKLGLGVEEKSFQEGAKWYMSAAFQQYGVSQHNLAFCYKCAEGVPRSDRVALYWFELSAEKGDKDAQYHVGMYHLHGANPHHYVRPAHDTDNFQTTAIGDSNDDSSCNIQRLQDHNFTSRNDWKTHFPVPTSVDDLLSCDAQKYAVNANFLLSDYVPVNIPRACYFLEKAYANGALIAMFYYALCLLHPEYHLYLRQCHRSDPSSVTSNSNNNKKKKKKTSKPDANTNNSNAIDDELNAADTDVTNTGDMNSQQEEEAVESIEEIIRSKIKLGLSLLEKVSESATNASNKTSDAPSPVSPLPVYTTQLMATYLLAEAYYFGFTQNNEVYGQDLNKAFHLLYDTLLPTLLKNVHKVLVTGIAAVIASNVVSTNPHSTSIVHPDALSKLPTWTNLLRNSVNMASSSLTYHGRMAMAEACALLGYAHAQYQGRLRLIPLESTPDGVDITDDLFSVHVRDVAQLTLKEKEQHHRLRDMFYYLAHCWRESISTSSSGAYQSNTHSTSTNINGGSTQYYYYHWSGLSRGMNLALAIRQENENVDSHPVSDPSSSSVMVDPAGVAVDLHAEKGTESNDIQQSQVDKEAIGTATLVTDGTISTSPSTSVSPSLAINPVNHPSKDYQLFAQIMDTLIYCNPHHQDTSDQALFKRQMFLIHTGRQTSSPILEHTYQPYLKHEYNHHYKEIVTMLMEQTPTVTHYPNQAAILANGGSNSVGQAKTSSASKTLTGEYIGYGKKLLPFLPTLVPPERTKKTYGRPLNTSATNNETSNLDQLETVVTAGVNTALLQDAHTLQHVLYTLHLHHLDRTAHSTGTNSTTTTSDNSHVESLPKRVLTLKSFPALNIPELLHKRDPFLCYNLALVYAQAPMADSFTFFQDLIEHPSVKDTSSKLGNKIDVYAKYLPPLILTQDHGEAFRLFRAAAEGALFCSDFDYATLGSNTSTDIKGTTESMVTPFANLFAYFALAWCYRYGTGVPYPVPNASVHYLSLPQSSHPAAIQGNKHRRSSSGSTKQRRHYQEARLWFARVAEKDEFDFDRSDISSELDWKKLYTITQARYELGIMWHKGRGGDRDDVEAWYHLLSSWLLVNEDKDGHGKKRSEVQKVEVKQAILNWVVQELGADAIEGDRRLEIGEHGKWTKDNIVQGLTSMAQEKNVRMKWLRDWHTQYHLKWSNIQHQYYSCLLTYLSRYNANAMKTSPSEVVDVGAIELKIEELKDQLVRLQDQSIEDLCQAIFANHK